MHFLAAAWWGAFNISSLFAKQVAPEKAQILQDLLLAASHLKAPDNEQSDKLTNLLGDKLPHRWPVAKYDRTDMQCSPS